MKHTDFDRAFGETPECVRAAIEAGFRAGAHAAARKGESVSGVDARRNEPRADVPGVDARCVEPYTDISGIDARWVESPRADVPGVDARWDESIPDRRESARGAGLPSPALRAARAAARRRKIAGAVGVAAVLALTLSVAVLSSARPGAPRPDTFRPVAQPDRGANGPYTSPTRPIASAPADSGADERSAAVAERPATEAEVYTTDGGRYYHADPECSGMQGARALSAEEAEALGKTPCPVCIGAADGGASMEAVVDVPTQIPATEEFETRSSNSSALNEEIHDASPAPSAEKAVEAPASNSSAPEGAAGDALPESPAEAESDAPVPVSSAPEGTVYATDGGRYLHALPDCCGMENARIMTVSEALKLGKAVCPNCIDVEDPVYATDGGRYFHVLSDCCGMENARATTVSQALMQGKAACPNCIGAVEVAFATDGGRYYHIDPACSGMENARFTTAAAAEAQGKAACPACLGAESTATIMNVETGASAAGAATGTSISVSVLPETEICEDFPKGGAAEASDTAIYAESGFDAPLNGAFDLDAMVCTSSETSLYHADPSCADGEDVQVMTVLSALTLGKSPCPACVGASTCVYATGDGPCYHALPDCSGMENARATALEIALNAGKAPCPVCVGADDLVYATGGGIYCHTEADCSGMRNAEAMPASRAGLLGKTPCPVCMAEKTELARTVLFNNALYLSTGRNADGGADSTRFYYTANGSWFHLTPDCSGMQSAGAHTLRELYSCGKKPCPLCFADETARELYRIPAPEGDGDAVLVSGFSSVSGCFHRDPFCFGMQMCYETTLAHARDFQNLGPCPACLPGLAGEADPMPCVVDADGAYYHLRDDCPHLGEGAQETTRLQAQASGRMHCPDCAALSSDGADRFEALFGFSLSEIEEGYSYERTDLRADGAREWFLSDGIEVDSLGLYAPDGVGGGTLSIGYEYDGGVQPWALSPELFARACEPLYALYWEYAPEALKECLADSENLKQTLTSCRGASLRFDADCSVTACMLSFASPGGSCDLGWEADENGCFQLAYRRCYGEGWTQAALQEKIGS